MYECEPLYKGLLRAAAIFVNDRQPDTRESARRLTSQLREAFVQTGRAVQVDSIKARAHSAYGVSSETTIK